MNRQEWAQKKKLKRHRDKKKERYERRGYGDRKRQRKKTKKQNNNSKEVDSKKGYHGGGGSQSGYHGSGGTNYSSTYSGFSDHSKKKSMIEKIYYNEEISENRNYPKKKDPVARISGIIVFIRNFEYDGKRPLNTEEYRYTSDLIVVDVFSGFALAEQHPRDKKTLKVERR